MRGPLVWRPRIGRVTRVPCTRERVLCARARTLSRGYRTERGTVSLHMARIHVLSAAHSCDVRIGRVARVLYMRSVLTARGVVHVHRARVVCTRRSSGVVSKHRRMTRVLCIRCPSCGVRA